MALLAWPWCVHGLRRCPGCLPLVIPPHQTCSQVAKPVATRRPVAQGHAISPWHHMEQKHRTSLYSCSGCSCTEVHRSDRRAGTTSAQALLAEPLPAKVWKRSSCSRHGGRPFLLCVEVLDAGKPSPACTGGTFSSVQERKSLTNLLSYSSI